MNFIDFCRQQQTDCTQELMLVGKLNACPNVFNEVRDGQIESLESDFESLVLSAKPFDRFSVVNYFGFFLVALGLVLHLGLGTIS